MPCIDCNKEQTRAWLEASRAANGLPPPSEPQHAQQCNACVGEAFIVTCLGVVVVVAVLVLMF